MMRRRFIVWLAELLFRDDVDITSTLNGSIEIWIWKGGESWRVTRRRSQTR